MSKRMSASSNMSRGMSDRTDRITDHWLDHGLIWMQDGHTGNELVYLDVVPRLECEHGVSVFTDSCVECSRIELERSEVYPENFTAGVMGVSYGAW